MNRSLLIAVLLSIAAGFLACKLSSQPRYQLTVGQAGIYRLDTRTGEVQLCRGGVSAEGVLKCD